VICHLRFFGKVANVLARHARGHEFRTYIHTYKHFSPTLIALGGEPSTDQRGGFFIACSQPWGLSASFYTTTRSTEGGKSRVWSGGRPPKWVARRWRRRSAVTVPGLASLQARAPARREWGSEFQSHIPESQIPERTISGTVLPPPSSLEATMTIKCYTKAAATARILCLCRVRSQVFFFSAWLELWRVFPIFNTHQYYTRTMSWCVSVLTLAPCSRFIFSNPEAVDHIKILVQVHNLIFMCLIFAACCLCTERWLPPYTYRRPASSEAQSAGANSTTASLLFATGWLLIFLNLMIIRQSSS